MATNMKAKVKKCAFDTILKRQITEFLNDKRKSNNIIDILKYTEESSEAHDVCESIRGLENMFTYLLEGDEMYLNYTLKERPETGLTSDEEYKVWLQKRYADTTQRLVELLHDHRQTVAEVSLVSLMKLVYNEAYHPVNKSITSNLQFPFALFQSIVLAVASPDVDTGYIITTFNEYMMYDDCRYKCMKIILNMLKSTPQDVPEVLLSNIVNITSQIKFSNKDDFTRNEFLPKTDASKAPNSTLYNQKKIFSNIWVNLLSKSLPTSMYKKVLLILSDKIMPNMTNPLLLADFLTTSYNVGGAISLLAMNGLFTLVYKHNLDYPDFYTKLYALFDVGVFHVKYKARFLHLADQFLSSSHLSAYLVAAFIKKMARLSLTAPASAQVVIIPFIINLIIRHPNCAILLNRTDSHKDVSTDPYNIDEPDPSKCRALDSSLWEIQTLQGHAYHKVSQLANMINHPLPKEEMDISGALDTDYDTLFKKECRKKLKTAAVTFDPPVSLLDEGPGQLWALN